MTSLTFTIDFHGPFHVGSGDAAANVDRVLDREHLLPGTSLKGLMRAEAEERLGLNPNAVAQVFGTRAAAPGQGGIAAADRRPSPWRWVDATVDAAEFGLLTRVQVDPRGHAERGFLMLGETVWATSATFLVELMSPLPIEDLQTHQTILRASARSVTGLGGGRRRGEGWCTVTDPSPWTGEDTRRLLAVGK